MRSTRPGQHYAPFVVVPASLVVNRQSGYKKLSEEGRCRMCLRTAAELPVSGHHLRKMTRHHLVPQWWFADNRHLFRTDRDRIATRDCDANVVPLCVGCHKLVDDRGGDEDARRMLRRSLLQVEVAFMIHLRGRAWLEQRYPLDIAHGD